MYAKHYFVNKFKSTKRADSSSFAAYAARATGQVAAAAPFQNSVMSKDISGKVSIRKLNKSTGSTWPLST
jgi:hypothetical protein